MGIWEQIQLVLVEPAKTVIVQIRQFLVNMVTVLFILLVGWLLCKILKAGVTRLCKFMRLDDLSERIELNKLLKKGGIVMKLSDLMGVIFYWLGIVVTLVVAVNAMGVSIASDLLNSIVLYVPNIIAAIFILILGMFIATVMRNIVKTAATNAGLTHSQLLSKIVETVVIVFAVMMTLEQLNIAPRIVELIISIFLASFGLAFALAFGFGCQDSARKLVNDIVDKFKSKG
ncbi:MAG: hypothetical protein MUC52_01725 [Candidatus Omnitrophica bacterium]|nr:hypothetical protein [Candidatus Omnitrophota bacterium]